MRDELLAVASMTGTICTVVYWAACMVYKGYMVYIGIKPD